MKKRLNFGGKKLRPLVENSADMISAYYTIPKQLKPFAEKPFTYQT